MKEEFSDRLRAARARAGLVQQKLADKLGVSLGSVGNWESGQNRPSPAMLKKVADELGVTIGWLLGDEPASQRQGSGEASVVADATPSWQRDLESRLALLPEWRLRRVLAAFHATLDALDEAPAADPPRARYSQPPPPPPSSARDTSMEAHAALVPAHMAPRPAASPRATPTVASPSGSEHGPATPPPHSIVQ